MRNPKRRDKSRSTARCVLAPPVWRLGVLVVIEIVIVILVAGGYDLPTALAYAAGGGMAASHVTHRLFDLSYRGGGAR
ncbi:hypothetical protein ACF08M_40485 [Streptomyces sp. NPDC015032]|uniref:hypothetical protein n=1 Tax=Streptomyces sp. NPDC015032 TaxID=3364937 RepID=UPI0036F8BFB6